MSISEHFFQRLSYNVKFIREVYSEILFWIFLVYYSGAFCVIDSVIPVNSCFYGNYSMIFCEVASSVSVNSCFGLNSFVINFVST